MMRHTLHTALLALVVLGLVACGHDEPPPKAEPVAPMATESVTLHRELKTVLQDLVAKDELLHQQQRDLIDVRVKMKDGSHDASKLEQKLRELNANNEKLLKEIKALREQSLDLDLQIQRSEYILKQHEKATRK